MHIYVYIYCHIFQHMKHVQLKIFCLHVIIMHIIYVTYTYVYIYVYDHVYYVYVYIYYIGIKWYKYRSYHVILSMTR